ncbi:FCD domain-containing protein [Gryllotalpicola sp.]|uniref:FadR/GntR family transcriptional regulator n=1 Tax=Gryllotalpicola sp. TaxID=1932787 RepID=UPI0026305779|nr:FCD domain-containing protein [Gryllotalpicola sp.]
MTDSAGESLLRPLRGGNAFEETVQRLLQMIRLGAVAPGERLPSERELAIRLGVSRDTLRDAIASLADAAYLVSRRGRYGGTFVADEVPADAARLAHDHPRPAFTAEAIDDALAVREVLELGAVRLAAGRALSAPERERLWQAFEESRAAEPADYRRLDSRLHLTIGELAGAPSLVPLFADARMRVNGLLDDIPLLPRNIAHSDEQHARIVGAILTGQAEAAEAAMAEHLGGTAALLRGFLS